MGFATTAYTVFFGSSLFYLAYYCYQDIKSRLVDQRPNYFLAGMAFLIFAVSDMSLTLKVMTVLISVGIRVFSSKIEGVGDGDTTTIAWQYLAASTLSFFHPLYYILIFALCTAVFYSVKYILERGTGASFGKPAYYPVITAAWVLFNALYGL